MRFDTYAIGNKTVQLRLTAAALAKHCEEFGDKGQNPIVCVVDALDNLPAKISLLTKALNFPGNQNNVRNGADLLDLLAEENKTQDDANCLILDIARTCGQLDEDDLADLRNAVCDHNKKLISGIVGLLNGVMPESVQREVAENPTTAAQPM